MKTCNDSAFDHWHILGAGAIGCLWAAHLALGGFKVTLILKNNERLRTFRKQNRIILEQQQKTEDLIVGATTANQIFQPVKNLLVCTKSFDALDAVTQVDPPLAPDTNVLLLLNGMGPQQEIAERYPELPIICGTTTDGCYRKDPFHVVHAGKGLTQFGFIRPEDNHLHRELGEEVAEFLASLKLNIVWQADISEPLWHKLAVNCAINPMTAIHQCSNGKILDNPEWLADIKSLCRETEAVMSALGIARCKPTLYDRVLQVAEATAHNYSSMYQDVTNGRRTEIDNINGYIEKQAERLNIPAPVNGRLYRTVKSLF